MNTKFSPATDFRNAISVLLLFACAQCTSDTSDAVEGYEHSKKALADATITHGPSDIVTGRAAYVYAQDLDKSELHNKARSQYDDAIRIFEKHYGTEDLEVMHLLRDSGLNLVAIEDFDGAYVQFSRVLEFYESRGVSAWQPLICIGILHTKRDDFAQAEEAFLSAIDESRKQTHSLSKSGINSSELVCINHLIDLYELYGDEAKENEWREISDGLMDAGNSFRNDFK